MNQYKCNIPWTKEFVNNNIDIIERNYSLFPTRNQWNCNCHVTHDYDRDVEPVDFNFLKTEYLKLSNEITKLHNISKFHLSDIWYNYYKEQQFQEPHIHEGNNGLTAVHYLIFDPECHSTLQFTDTSIKLPEIECGDIVLFPDSWEHYVPENKSNKPRLTTAFTITNDGTSN